MTLNLEAKKILLRKIPHGLFICGVRDEDKNEKPIIVSIIQNSNNIDKEKAFKLLRDVYHLKSC